ncbi:MAG: MBL fold metallo-hydrolase [Candidatus Yanofskybacteria bacterium]|nr:MBL fold metallo-hydrolase [Candidatus Yanofskybacteria bacterium]
MKLTFYGGATHVTGANYLLEAGGLRILVDCGMIQGSRYSDEMNAEPLGYDAASVDYLFVTHSHVDHIGRIPKLYREGFRGVIYASEPTAAITAVALPDTLDKIVSEAKACDCAPLYDRNDMEGALALMRGVPYRQRLRLSHAVTVEGHDSGHVLGSTAWEFTIEDQGVRRRIVFPGDIGNPPSTLLQDIDYVRGVDYMLVESAYGSRIHEARSERRQMLLDVIRETYDRKGVLMIPSFAVERTQELMLELDTLFEAGDLPKMPVFVDSPLAIDITKVYGRFSSYFNAEAREILKDNRGIFQFPWLTFTPSVPESKHINDVPAPKIVVAGSGMSQGGRILHHESRYLPDNRNTILFIGYQVEGSLGRRIRDGAKDVTIFGNHIPVRCHMRTIGAYSAHADQNGLIEYIRQANQGDSLKKCFVVQGEEDAAQTLADRARQELKVDAVVPRLGESFEL